MTGYEAIEYLCENKFKRLKTKMFGETLSLFADCGIIKITNENGIAVSITLALMYVDWQLIQQPITLTEALKAYEQGKTVKHVLNDDELLTSVVKAQMFNKLYLPAISLYRLTRGKWYVED